MEIDGEKESLLRDVVNKIESLYLEKKNRLMKEYINLNITKNAKTCCNS